jgi:hypothetical protein
MENITNTDIALNGPQITANLRARVSYLALA